MTNWQSHEQAKKGRSQEHTHHCAVAALEKRKLEIIKKVNQLDHIRNRYMQSFRAINEQIVELEKGEFTP